MKNWKFIKQIPIVFIILCLAFAAECNANNKVLDSKDINHEDNHVLSSQYFKKGVYVVYATEDKKPSKYYFYIFHDEKSGYTEDGKYGIGLPFECEQTNGTIKFFFGGPDPENMDILTIESAKDGNITGYFKDEKGLIFAPLPDANPDDFDSQKYLKKYKKSLKKAKPI